MAGFNDFSTTPLSNSSVGAINFAENQLPSTVNNSARQLMADLRYELGTISSDLTAGATTDLGAVQAGTIVVIGSSTIGSFGSTGTAGLRKRIKVTGTPTVSVSTAGAIRGPTNAAIVCQANDVFDVLCEASDQWRITNYLRADGTAITNTIADNSIANAKLVQMAANTIKGNNTVSAANQADLTATQVRAMLPGIALQVVKSQVSGVSTGTTTIPFDDTIPQNTEGTQFLTVSITPISATSTLVIEVVANVALSSADVAGLALFQDSTAGALAAVADYLGSLNVPSTMKLIHTMTSGTTSATTFKVRIGGASGETVTLNGTTTNRFFGGVAASAITVTEYAA